MPVNVTVIMAFAFWAADAERRHTIAAVPNTFFVSAVLATVCHDAESFFVVMTTGRFQFGHINFPNITSSAPENNSAHLRAVVSGSF